MSTYPKLLFKDGVERAVQSPSDQAAAEKDGFTDPSAKPVAKPKAADVKTPASPARHEPPPRSEG